MANPTPDQPLVCDQCLPPTRLVEEGSLTWGRRLGELIPFMLTGALLLAALAPVILLLRLGITGQMGAVTGVVTLVFLKIGIGALFGLVVGLLAGLFGGEGGLLGGVILGVLMALVFAAAPGAPFDPAARLEIVLVSCLGGAACGALGYLAFTLADKRVVPK